MPSNKKTWREVVALVLGDKESMKEAKLVQRCLKQARQSPALSALTKAEAADGLRAFFGRGETSGFVVRGGRVHKAASASPPASLAAPPPPEPPLRKRRKKSQGANAGAAAAPAPALDNEVAAPSGPGEASPPPAEAAAEPPDEARPKKRHKKSKSGAAVVAAQGAPESDGEEADADQGWRDSLKRSDVKSGPFSKDELAALRAAVCRYAEKKGLSTEDFSWAATARRGARKTEAYGLWKEVAASLPRRTIKAVAAAGVRELHPAARQGKWSSEQDARLRALVEERGNRWVEIGAALGRTNAACRDRWKEIRLGARKAQGKWAEEEVARLEAAVQQYLESKSAAQGEDGAGEGEGLERRAVLDDVDWGVVSQRVGTRSNLQCLEKWYDQVAPSMVARGDWGAGDDRRMLRALWRAAPGAEFEADWGTLVAGRAAAQARRRWRLMARTVRDHRDKEFAQLLEELVGKHFPQWAEAAAAAAAEPPSSN